MAGRGLKLLDRFQFSVFYLSKKHGVTTGVVAVAPVNPKRLQVEIGMVQGVDTALLRQIRTGSPDSIDE